MIRRVAASASLLLVGIYAGGVVFTVLAPGLGRLPGPAFVRYWQTLNDDYARVMPVLLLLSVATLIATAVLSRRDRVACWPTITAAVLVVAGIVLTVTQLEPLNQLADSWDPDALPGDWAATRDQWNDWHLVRTVLAVGAFGCLLIGHVGRAEPVRSRDGVRGPEWSTTAVPDHVS